MYATAVDCKESTNRSNVSFAEPTSVSAVKPARSSVSTYNATNNDVEAFDHDLYFLFIRDFIHTFSRL